VTELKGRVAVITGGASGIGRAMAATFADQGMKVVIADIEEAALNKTVSELRKSLGTTDGGSGGSINGLCCDITSYDSVVSLEKQVRELHGNVHILCNNAGVGPQEDVPLWELPLSDWRWTLDVNVWGVIHGIKAFVPGMIAHSEPGHVVNTSSGNGGLILLPTTPIYSASKATVSSITESHHLQLSMQNAAIHAHVLYPGPHIVNTNIFDARRNRLKRYEREVEQASDPVTLAGIEEIYVSMGRKFETTQPEEVAAHALKAILDDSYYILPWSNEGEALLRSRVDGIFARRNPEPVF